MPAESRSQQRTANAALAVKHGHLNPKTLPSGFRKAVLSMAQMSEEQLKDFQHLKHEPQTLLKGKG